MAQVFTDADFKTEVLSSEIPVLVDFWAEWCGPCVMMGPIIEEVAKDYEGKMKIGKLNVDSNPETAQKYSVMSIPSFKFFKNGEVVEELTGTMTKEALVEKIEAQL